MPKNEDRREQVLDRLWELAKLSPEMTRNRITGQVKAIQIIVAIEGLIPDRRAASSGKESASPLPPADIYQAEWLRQRQGKPDPAPAPQEQEPHPVEPEPLTTPAAAADAPPPPVMPIGPAHDRSQSVFAHLFHPSDGASSAPQAPALGSVPDTRLPLWQLRIPIARRRR